jgi:uncharacterized protein (DUF2249 family)
MSTTANLAAETIDIRLLGPCADRKARVLAAFDALIPGASLNVVNDHLPNGLRAHFEEQRPGAFSWRVLEAGPVVFRVEITRVA